LVVRVSRKFVLVVVLVLLVGAGVAAWFLVPWSIGETVQEVPRGYITLTLFDMQVTGTELNPPDPSEACTLVGVNNSGKSVESVLLKFATKAELTFAFDTSGFGSTDGEFRASKPLQPGERSQYIRLPAPGTLESVTVGWGPRAKEHVVAVALAAGRRLVISFGSDGTVSTRTE
jgi:hypothetical protein